MHPKKHRRILLFYGRFWMWLKEVALLAWYCLLLSNLEVPFMIELPVSNRQRSRRIDMYEIIVLERSGTFQHYFVRGVLQ